MLIRKSTPADGPLVLEFYKEVAAIPGGLARLLHEITASYVDDFLAYSSLGGLSLIAEDPKGHIVGEIHAYCPGIQCFSHVLSDLTIAIHPRRQGEGLGRLLFNQFLQEVTLHFPHIQRVELLTRESNIRAIQFYSSLGFQIEGRMSSRICGIRGEWEADIPMAWLRR